METSNTSLPTEANSRQVGGSHYQASFQHWDLVAHCNMSYFPAQISRYAGRSRKKNGLQDIEKAIHYCEKFVELHGIGAVSYDDEYLVSQLQRRQIYLDRYSKENRLNFLEHEVTRCMVFFDGRDSLDMAKGILQDMAASLRSQQEGSAATSAYVNQDRGVQQS